MENGAFALWKIEHLLFGKWSICSLENRAFALWKMEHLLFGKWSICSLENGAFALSNKCSIFHNTFITIQNFSEFFLGIFSMLTKKENDVMI